MGFPQSHHLFPRGRHLFECPVRKFSTECRRFLMIPTWPSWGRRIWHSCGIQWWKREILGRGRLVHHRWPYQPLLFAWCSEVVDISWLENLPIGEPYRCDLFPGRRGIIVGISMKVEGSNCGRGERFLLRQQELSFPSWLSVCTMKASMGSLRWHELWGWTWCAFNPLRVRKEPFRAPKKRKMDEGETFLFLGAEEGSFLSSKGLNA